MTVTEIKKACNNILKTAVSGCTVYGNDTKDGYIRPAFFTEILPRTWHTVSASAIRAGFTYKATLLETTHDEAYCLEVVDAVRNAFGMTIKCESGFRLLVEDFDFDWIDSGNDILQITIDFAEFVLISNLRGKPWAGDMMEILDMDVYVQPSGMEMRAILRAIKLGEIRFKFDDHGHLIAQKIGMQDEYLRFDVDGSSGHLTASMIEALSQALTFYATNDGHIFARYKSGNMVGEMFNIYVTAKEI